MFLVLCLLAQLLAHNNFKRCDKYFKIILKKLQLWLCVMKSRSLHCINCFYFCFICFYFLTERWRVASVFKLESFGIVYCRTYKTDGEIAAKLKALIYFIHSNFYTVFYRIFIHSPCTNIYIIYCISYMFNQVCSTGIFPLITGRHFILFLVQSPNKKASNSFNG